ncbi:OmpA family protein [Flavobacterium hercynium]|uniref:Flagellar motor protein MotB n=1 Tax=Flavobacterium hercynium TaxID=387094 RepID=A0A226HRM0_9FLAO|nr:OmpA family protein [Flavobacterium hercynium]OXA96271.1 flagellar motor protein MotB [Flavobacterium hercynium]SMP04545.1 WD40-like Beta Propeller Repeat [Flavobacterium hercynium]
MKIKNLAYTFLFLCFYLNLNAQKANLKDADKKYDNYAYADAIKSYENLLKKGYQDEKVLQRLGNSYYFTGDLTQALRCYETLFIWNENQEADYLYKYAECLKATGNYAKSDEILEKFIQKVPSDNRAVLIKKNRNYLEDIKANSGRYEIADAGINSEGSEYGSTILDNKLIFASSRDTGSIVKKNFKWTNKSVSALYFVELMPDGSIGKQKLFRKKQKSNSFNESTPVFTKDGKTMYFTRNNFINGKKGQSENKITLLKLYKASLIGGEWKEIQELPFNSDQYSAAHPALSIDEKTLYFASDMPGTLGQSDLFKVSINADETFGKPENLGSEINTEGRESFPFISEDNELYFASDGRPGLGGLDVFVSKINSELSYDEVQNLGEPINSRKDDFAFIINSKNRNGFFSSNRDNGHGLDDVYRFTELRRLVCEQEVSGTITDAETGEVLSDVRVMLFDEARQTAVEVLSDKKGNYVFSKVKCGKKYFIKTAKEEYEIKEATLTLKKASGKTTSSLAIEKKAKPMLAKAIQVKTIKINAVTVKPIAVGTDLAKLLKIPMNFFDLGKATIKKTSEPQLQKVVKILKEYPTLQLDIRSHTDSRQSSASNMILSEKRAESTKNWLIKKGIDGSRLTSKGFGETQLVNKCADGVKCTEKQHQQNRRSEFIITSL